MSASEKTTVLARVASSTLPKRQVLKDLGVPKSTYYRWLTREQRCQGLENQPGGGLVPWNRLSQPEEQAVLTVARRAPELSCRQLAAWITDNQGFSVSESTVYRILRREGLVKSPEMQLKAGKEYHRKTTGPNQMWATDASYFKVVGWVYYYLVTVMDDFSRFILAHKLQRDMTSDLGAGYFLILLTVRDQIGVNKLSEHFAEPFADSQHYWDLCQAVTPLPSKGFILGEHSWSLKTLIHDQLRKWFGNPNVSALFFPVTKYSGTPIVNGGVIMDRAGV